MFLTWTARLLSVCFLVFFAAFAIGEGFVFAPTIAMVAFITMLIGLIVGWKWELTGSWLVLGGFVLFTVANGLVPSLLVVPLIGVLWLVNVMKKTGRV